MRINQDQDQDQDQDTENDVEEIQEPSASIAYQEVASIPPPAATKTAAKTIGSLPTGETSDDPEAVEIQVRPNTAAKTTDQEKAPEAKPHGNRRLLCTGTCPVCGEQRKHLRAHLATRKPGHGWSAEKYECWLFEKQSEGRKDRHRVRECPKGCGWSGIKLERHLEVHHGVQPKSQAMGTLKAKSKALSRDEHSRKRPAEEETSSASSKKIRLEETRQVGLNKNTAKLLKPARKIGKKRPAVLESSSESEQEDVEAEETMETAHTHSDSALSDDKGEVSDDGQNDETNKDDEEEENVDGDKEEENLGPYGPSSRPTNVFETLLRGWNIHLATPDGTEKTPAMIRQMCHHVATIAKAVDPSARDLGVFLDKNLVYKRFFKRQLELRKQDRSQGYCSKTLSCFSTSLQRFVSYAIRNMRQSLSSEKREALEDIRDAQSNWREAWGKTIAQQRAEVEWEAERNLPTKEEVRNIQSSEHVQKIRRMLMHPKRHHNLTTEDAAAVRNYLIFMINMENASRAGPVAEITLGTFEDGRMVDNKWTIHISKQKTTRTRGGLILNFSSDLRLMIIKYVDHFRPLLARNGNFNTDAMFLNSTGSPYTNSHVHHALKQFAARTGCLREESLSAFCSSMLRHFVVTNTRGLSSPEKNSLASKMGHSRSTADKWYNLINKMKAASEAHDTVTSLFDADCSFNAKDEKKALAGKQERTETDKEGEPLEEDRKEASMTEPQDDDKETLAGSALSDVIPPSETAYSGMASIFSTRRHWSRSDIDQISSVCHDEITGAVGPTRTTIIRKLHSNPETNHMVQSEGAERAYQKVKHMRRNYHMQNNK